jgi:hypothetical protein
VHVLTAIGEFKKSGNPNGVKAAITKSIVVLRSLESAIRLAVVRDTPEPQDTLAVSGLVISVIREGAFRLLGLAAGELSTQAQTRHDMRDLATATGARASIAHVTALLDEVGWTGELDRDDVLYVAVRRHGPTIIAALNNAIPLLEIGLRELSEAQEDQRPQRELVLAQTPPRSREWWPLRSRPGRVVSDALDGHGRNPQLDAGHHPRRRICCVRRRPR